MVKLENGLVTKDNADTNGDCQELLSPPEPSSPRLITRPRLPTSSSAKVNIRNGCSEDTEAEPLLQRGGSAAMATASATNSCDDNDLSEDARRRLHNGDLTIPIFVTSDRLSVDTAATASLHSSPSHCLNPAAARASQVINPCLLQNVSTGSSRDHRSSMQISQPDEVVAIQMTSSSDSRRRHSEDGGNGVHVLSDRDVFECSWKSMCGPKPKRISVILFITLAVWASFILGLNVYKQVSYLETNLSSMTEKVHHLQRNYLDMQDNALKEIHKLKEHIQEIKARQHLDSTSSSNTRPERSRKTESAIPTRSDRQGKSIEASKTRMPATTTTATPLAKSACSTTNDVPCIFPFKFNGEEKFGCVQRWMDIKPWCPTKLDDTGNVLRFDLSSWGNCQEECPIS